MSGARGPVAVVTDSTAYLPAGMVEEHGLTVVPLQVVVGGRSLAEGVEVSSDEVARALQEWRPVTTSRPSPQTFAETYRSLGVRQVVSVHLSADLSGTADAARVARRLAPEVGIWLYVDTLDYLRRGGRIGAAAAVVGSALSVKPLLHVVDGRLEPLERVRTTSRALSRLEELAVREAGDRDVDVAVQHLAPAGRAQEMAERLRARLPRARTVHVGEVGAVVGAHVGPGMLGVVVVPAT